MIPAVSSTSAASTSTAASRQNSEDSIRSIETEGTTSSAQVDRESAVVTISQEAALQAAKPTDSNAGSENTKAAGAAASSSAAAAGKSTTASADKPASNADAIAAAAAGQTQSSSTATKPDWVYLAADGNKDGKVTVFEQQAYDFRHYPSSLEKAKAYNKSLEEPKVDAKVSA